MGSQYNQRFIWQRSWSLACSLSSADAAISRHRARGENAMTSIGWKSAVRWSLLGLVLLLFGPAPAVAWDLGQIWLDLGTLSADVVLYEVTEDMYLKDAAGNFVMQPVAGAPRTPVARRSGWATLGRPRWPRWAGMR